MFLCEACCLFSSRSFLQHSPGTETLLREPELYEHCIFPATRLSNYISSSGVAGRKQVLTQRHLISRGGWGIGEKLAGKQCQNQLIFYFFRVRVGVPQALQTTLQVLRVKNASAYFRPSGGRRSSVRGLRGKGWRVDISGWGAWRFVVWGVGCRGLGLRGGL